MNNTARPLRIAALGMERRTYSTLQLFFQGPCKNSYVLVEEPSADISIIDLDGLQANHLVEVHRKQYPLRPAIVISVTDKQINDAVFLRKPLQFAALSTALQTAEQQLQTGLSQQDDIPVLQEAAVLPHEDDLIRSAELDFREYTRYAMLEKQRKEQARQAITEPDKKDKSFKAPQTLDTISNVDDSGVIFAGDLIHQLNPHNPLQLSKLQYDPEQLLQGYFQKAYNTALASRCDVRLEGPWRPITIFSRTRECSVESNFRHLYALSATSFRPEQVTISILDEQDPRPDPAHSITQSVEQILWKLSLRSSRGRVPVKTNLSSPVRLQRWPNFTRVSVTPHAVQIAALWSKRPTSLMETAHLLKIPVNYVFVFYSAALSLGLVSHDSESGEGMMEPRKSPVRKHKNRNLFQAIIKRLRNLSSENIE